MIPKLKLSNCIIAFLSSAFQAFGIYNIHSQSCVTEGGIFGLTLLIQHWLSISPAVSSFILNAACYALGWRTLGKEFIGYSIVASCGYSVGYAICELFPPLWPEIAAMPLTASIIGALFIGIGAGFCVRAGGATSGDDALAMSLSHLTRVDIQWIYLISDLTVLALSLSYIPLRRIAYSLLTVILSGQIIGIIQKINIKERLK
ncbi:MAG: YitT family protein [Oscillospiraceae bacterium]|nr:YitT family protein [Oscillospiraceae bacterium]